MPIAPGTRIGPYEVESLIGAGGMGEVYRARDERLHRAVALKFVRADANAPADADRLYREARAAAALDHPFICKIYEVGQTGDATFIAMEFVSGRTLADRLDQGPLPLSTALAIAIEIVEALNVAHRRGIVHRDLKPANVMLADDGHVKMLDFGLASKAEAAEGETTWLATHNTSTKGTLPYMAPEQLSGEAADARSDLFAFGIVLTRMITGRHPFGDGTGIEIASAILHADPRPWPDAPSVPAQLRQIARKLLMKSRDDRYQSAADLLVDLRAVTSEVSSGAIERDVTRQVAVGKPRRSKAWAAALIAAGVLVTGGAALALLVFSRLGTSVEPTVSQVTTDGDLIAAAIAPDGRSLAYITEEEGTRRLLVRDIGAQSALELARNPWLDNLAWFPDGTRLHYTDRRAGWAIARFGGVPQPSFNYARFAISPDGTKVATAGVSAPGIGIFGPTGERIKPMWLVPGAGQLFGTDWGAKTNRLMAFGTDTDRHGSVWTITPDLADLRKVYTYDEGGVTEACWSPIANVVYLIRALPSSAFDLVAIDLDRGSPTPRVLASGLPPSDAMTVSSDGRRLVVLRGQLGVNLVSIDLTHPNDRPHSLTRGTGGFSWQSVSPDGQWVLAVSGNVPKSIVKLPMSGGEPAVLVPPEGDLSSPAWSPDGRQIAFVWNRNGAPTVWVMDADGRNRRPVETSAVGRGARVGWTPDGRIVWSKDAADGVTAGFAVSSVAGGKEESLVREGVALRVFDAPMFSPTGDRLVVHAFQSAGTNGLWMLTWPQRVEHLVAKDVFPIGWSADGESIYATGSTDQVRIGIWQVSAKTGESHLIASLPTGRLNIARLAPDHTHVILSVIESRADAWMTDHFDPRVGR